MLVTGGSGFIGQAVLARLAGERHMIVRTAVRRDSPGALVGAERILVGDICDTTSWGKALENVSCVIHLAARVHILRDRAADPLAEYRRVNVEGTLNLAQQAAKAGVRRFIYLSSLKVNGEVGSFTETDLAAPQDAYAISKHEAEVGLREIARTTGMQVVIIRPTLVYGEGAKGNFKSLTKLVASGIPLPLGSINNRRNLVGIDNLVDFIITCLEHPAAANETFLVSDGQDLSTPDLMRRMARAMNRPARLLPVPTFVLKAVAAMLGRRGMAQRLFGSLQVDISKSRQLLGWNPPFSVDEGLKRAVGGN